MYLCVRAKCTSTSVFICQWRQIHPSLVVKHYSLTSLIRLLLNQLSVCFLIPSVSLTSLSIFLLLSSVALCFVTLHLFPHFTGFLPTSASICFYPLSPHSYSVRGVGEYNRVNHSHSGAVSLSIYRAEEGWNTLSSSTYRHATKTLTRYGREHLHNWTPISLCQTHF